MPTIANWLNWVDAGNTEAWQDGENRGAGVGFMLGHRGVSITLYRQSVAQAAQTVIVAPFGRGGVTSAVQSDAGTAGEEELLILGSVTLDIQINDEFAYNTAGRRNYKVSWVDKSFTGMKQARAKVTDNG
jgi:hypothetical protein